MKRGREKSAPFDSKLLFVFIKDDKEKKMDESMELMNYIFEKHPVRITDRDGNPWFVAKDVCDVLGHTNVTQALKKLDNDEKGMITRASDPNLWLGSLGGEGREGGAQGLNIINESGVYHLIFRSRLPVAKVFRKWVTSEVLPEIRKKGYYDMRELRRENEELKLLVSRESPKVIGLREADIYIARHYASGRKESHIFLEAEYAKFNNRSGFHVTKTEFLAAVLQRFPEAKLKKITVNSTAIHGIYDYY
jgi:prophage antirepressor-like protein